MKINYPIIIKVLKVFIPFLLLVIIYYPTLNWLYDYFRAPDSYYSHGFLIPLIVIYLVWKKKEIFKNIKSDSILLGSVLIIFSFLLQVISMFLETYILSEASLFIMIFGVTLYLCGRQIVKQLLFPLFFLIFMFPIPMFLLNYFTFPMRLLATKSAVFILKVINLPVSQKGTEILFPNSSLMVETPCSGLRSLITFLALGSLIAYFLNTKKSKKIILVLLTVPLAFVCNLLRILFLSLVTFVYGAEIATHGFIHDFSGFFVFFIGFIVLISIKRVLECKE